MKTPLHLPLIAAILTVWSGLAQSGLAPLRQNFLWQPVDPTALPTEADQALEELAEEHAQQWAVAGPAAPTAGLRRLARADLMARLEKYLEDYPGNRWETSLHLYLGTHYQRQARCSRALPHLMAAWQQSQDPRIPGAQRFADQAQVVLGLALLELGRAEALEELMRQAGGEAPSAPGLGAVWRAVREGWAEVRQDPALASMMCGAEALSRLARALEIRQLSPQDVLQAATAQDARGFTLARLQEIGRRHGLPLQAAVRSAGSAWIVPAVVHWKEDLWRTVLEPQGAGFWVHDPTRGRIWMSSGDLERESSGYWLLPTGTLPAGWRLAGEGEAAMVVGRSYARLKPDATDSKCSSDQCPSECPPGRGGGGGGAGGGGGSGSGSSGNGGGGGGGSVGGSSNCSCIVAPCYCPGGLVQWRVSEPFINVWLEDDPWGYAPSIGPAVRLDMNYKLRDASTSTGTPLLEPWDSPVCDWSGSWGTPASSSLGVGWTSRWFTYVRVLERGDESTPDHLVVRTPERGFLDLYLGYNVESIVADPVTRAVLRRLRDNQGQQVGWELAYPDGSLHQYALKVDDGTEYSTEDFYFLTRYEDRTGMPLQFEYQVEEAFCEDPVWGDWYHTVARLTGIRDATGLLSTLAYNNAVHPTLITSITDPYGRTASFAYDTAGYLTNITDVAGIQAGFEYAEVGQPSPRLLWRVTTPYGATEFQIPDNVRSVLVLLPEGRRQLAYYERSPIAEVPSSFTSAEVPQDLPVANAADTYNRNRRNSYVWGMAQAAQLSTTNIAALTAQDYRLARTRHWLLERGTQYPEAVSCQVSTTLAWEKAPSPDGTQEGAITWYGHDGKDYAWAEGTSILPNLIARVMPDGSTGYEWIQRNALGFATARIERWLDTGNTERFRTNRFVYAANGVDVIAQYGPGDDLEAGFTYDASHPHLPVAATNAVGEITRYYYDTAQNGHRLLGMAHASGLATTNLYTGAWLERTVDFLGATPLRTNLYTWLDGRVRTHTDPRGLTLTHTHDALGRLTRLDFPDSTYLQHAYTNGAGVMLLDRTATRDRLGNWSYTEYDGLRQVTRLLDPLLRETRYTYCGCGGPESVTRAYGTTLAETTGYSYDFAGRLVLVTEPDGTSVTNTYDAVGRLAIVSRAYGTSTNYFDNLNRLWVVENAAGTVSELVYDDHDRVLAAIDASAVTVTNSYDPLGRLLTRTLPALGAVESFGYTAGVSGPTAYTNQVGDVTLHAYDAAGRKTNEVQVGVFTNRFTYTPAGDLLTLADGKGSTTTWKYDTEGRVTEKWYQGQYTADLLYAYNVNGWLTNRFTRTGTGSSTNGYVTGYAFDSVGNLTNIAYPTGTASITNWFDALNRVTNRLDGLGQTKYTYVVLGNGQRTFAEDGPWTSDDVTVTNRHGRRAGLTIAQSSGQFAVTNAWDAAGRWHVVGGTAGTFTYGYPADSATPLPNALTLPGGGYITNNHDAVARLTRTELRTSAGAILNAHGYQYNLASQRTMLGRTNSAASSWNGYVNALYDPAGQLTNAWTYLANGTPVTTEKWSYGYDAAQNLAKRTNNTTVEIFTVNALNQLTAIPDSTPSYDRRGNLTLRSFSVGQPWVYWSYAYDAENQLTSVTTDTAYTPTYNRFKVEFTYDGQGRLRVKKDYVWSGGGWYGSGGETRYLYDGMLVIQDRDGGGTPLVTYTRGRDLSGGYAGAGGIGGLLARSHGYSGGTWSSHNFYHADGNGNVTALASSGGTLQASYKYDPYGRYRGQLGTLAATNVMRFSSKPWVAFAGSTTAGLYYYGYRFYDPYLQRWVNRDPIGETSDRNLYRFAQGSAYSRCDPYGLDLISLPGATPVVPFPRVPKTRPRRPLPQPPIPPGVNTPPPCAPYPECLRRPPEEPDISFEDCWRDCMTKMTFGYPVEVGITSGASGFGRLVLTAAQYPGTVCPFLLGLLPAWGGGAAMGCALGCAQGLGLGR